MITQMVQDTTTGLRRISIQRNLTDTASYTPIPQLVFHGPKHRSNGYTEIPGLSNRKEFAFSILVTTIKEASFMFVQTNGIMDRVKQERMQESKDAFLFLSSTSFDKLVEKLGIPLSADRLREVFYDRFDIQVTLF